MAEVEITYPNHNSTISGLRTVDVNVPETVNTKAKWVDVNCARVYNRIAHESLGVTSDTKVVIELIKREPLDRWEIGSDYGPGTKSFTFDTERYDNGTYVIRATLCGVEGRDVVADEICVTIDNVIYYFVKLTALADGNPVEGLDFTVEGETKTTDANGEWSDTYAEGTVVNFVMPDRVTLDTGKDIVFDHWEDGSTSRTRDITVDGNESITAYYVIVLSEPTPVVECYR